MVFRDRVYGRVNIHSDVISELVNSKPLQRLKGIAQFGIPDEFYHMKNYSRYEHSVGVMLLLRKLGASEEEQIAGLLHDVSHTAFSHTIDYVFGDGKTQDYQDEQHASFVFKSEIPGILAKHGYSPDRIINFHEHFGLLERPAPDLCADRVDYTLREFPRRITQTCLPAITVKDNRIIFANKDAASVFASNYIKLNVEHWSGFESVSRFRLFADMLKRALVDRVINHDDFWQDDAFVINKLRSSNDKNIRAVLELLKNNSSLGHMPKSNSVSYGKFRYVDPLYIENGNLVRLTDSDPDFAEVLEKTREFNDTGILVPAYYIQ